MAIFGANGTVVHTVSSPKPNAKNTQSTAVAGGAKVNQVVTANGVSTAGTGQAIQAAQTQSTSSSSGITVGPSLTGTSLGDQTITNSGTASTSSGLGGLLGGVTLSNTQWIEVAAVAVAVIIIAVLVLRHK